MKILCLLLVLVVASPLMAYPLIGNFDITYAEFTILPPPLAVSFISEYCDSKYVIIDDVRMTDIDKFIRDYAEREGHQTLMPEILDKMIEIYGKKK